MGAAINETAAKQPPLLKKNIFRLILLTISGAAIYTLPYFRLTYYDVYLEMYNLTHVQMGALGSAYGLLGLISYLLGGVLADAVSARKLLAFSLVVTGLGGVAHLLTDSFTVLLIIYGMWGITSLLTFWPALIKAIRMMANNEEQGRAFGIFEGVRGVVNAIILPSALAIFGFIAAGAGEFAGIHGVIVFFSAITTLCGIIVFFTIADTEKVADRKKFEVKQLVAVFKKPSVWLLCFILFMSYTYIMSFWYFTPYTTEVLGGTVVMAAAVTILAQYCRPIGSIGASFLGVKVGNPRIRLYSTALMALGTAAIILIPGNASMMPFFIVACVVIYLAMYANYGLVFAMLEEGNIPLHMSGIAIGFISTLGYLPEVLVPIVAGTIFDRFPGAQGFHYYFMILTACCVLAFIGVLIWIKKYGNKNVSGQPENNNAATDSAAT